MIYRSNSGDFRAIGLRPLGGNIDGCQNIGIASKTARTTREFMFLSGSDSTAARASLRGISRIHEDHGNAGLCCLVCDELAQHVERPSAHHPAHALALVLDSLDYPLEVFERKEAACIFCYLNDSLADLMIDTSLESAFSVTEPFQQPFTAACAFGLERCLSPGKLLALAIDLAPGQGEAIGKSCDSIDAEIDSQRVCARCSRRFGFNAEISVEAVAMAVVVDGARAALPALQKRPLIISHAQGKSDSSANSGSRGFFSGFDVAEKVFIDDEACRFECRRVSIASHSIKHPNAVVSREAVFFANVMIVVSRQYPAMKHLLPVAVEGYLIAGLSEANHSFRDGKSLIFSDYQLAFHGFNHETIISTEQRGTE